MRNRQATAIMFNNGDEDIHNKTVTITILRGTKTPFKQPLNILTAHLKLWSTKPQCHTTFTHVSQNWTSPRTSQPPLIQIESRFPGARGCKSPPKWRIRARKLTKLDGDGRNLPVYKKGRTWAPAEALKWKWWRRKRPYFGAAKNYSWKSAKNFWNFRPLDSGSRVWKNSRIQNWSGEPSGPFISILKYFGWNLKKNGENCRVSYEKISRKFW